MSRIVLCVSLALALACGGIADTGGEAVRPVEARNVDLDGRWCLDQGSTCYVFAGDQVIRDDGTQQVEGEWTLDEGQILALFPDGSWIARIESIDGDQLVVYDLREGATRSLTRVEGPADPVDEEPLELPGEAAAPMVPASDAP